VDVFDLIAIWKHLDNGVSNGSNSLVKIAIYILSIITNSGGCEHTFSHFSIIHSKLHSKLTLENAHKTLTVQMDIHQRHTAASLTHPCSKQKFGEMEGSPITETYGNTSTSNNEAVAAHSNPDTIMLDIHEIMEDLIEAVNNKDAKDDPLPTIPNPLPAPGLCLASQQCIPLSELFIYPKVGAANPLAFYWKGGLQNIQ
jgi:hypothetical protein